MSWRGTLLLILLALGALGYSFFSGRSTTHPPGEPLLGNTLDLTDSVLMKQGEDFYSLIKTNGFWDIQSSFTDRANPSMVHDLLSAAADITPLDTLSPHDLKGAVSLSSLGLKKPKRSLTFHSNKKQTLLIGVEGPSTGKLYARLDGDRTVYLIDGKIASLAFHPAVEYRDPRLTALSSDHLQSVTLLKGEALQQLQLERDARGWLLKSPSSARGDDQVITTWIDSLLGAKIDRWMPDGTDASSCGMDAPTAQISFQEEEGKTLVKITLGAVVGNSPSSYFVRCSDRPGICVISGLAPALAVTPQTLRSKQIKQVEYDTIDRIEINGVNGLLSLKRKSGSDAWETLGGKVLSLAQVKAWFDRLQGVTATGFEAATPEHLKLRGLDKDHPNLRIRLMATLSENTAQENAGEVVLAEYNFGTPTNNEIALREGTSDDLTILPEQAFDPIQNEPLSWDISLPAAAPITVPTNSPALPLPSPSSTNGN